MEGYILSGDPTALAKVLQENRVRISRGEITFTPAIRTANGTWSEEGAADAGLIDGKDFYGFDTKEVDVTDTKTVKKPSRATTKKK